MIYMRDITKRCTRILLTARFFKLISFVYNNSCCQWPPCWSAKPVTSSVMPKGEYDMTARQSLTGKFPLKDYRDMMARIGVRFFWCTGPYFLVAGILSIFGNSKMYAPWPALLFVSIPFMGGIIDWYRLTHRTNVPKTSP